MQIITLTSDMGLKDHYVASMKGTVLGLVPEAHIIDVSHNIRPFNVAEAAYQISCCYADFPAGTVHVIGVDSEPMINFGGTDGAFPCIMVFAGQYFISSDNGFFGTFLKDEQPDAFYRIDDVMSNPKLFKFPTKSILIPAACRLLNGEKVTDFCSPQENYKRAFLQTAVVEQNLIKGNVCHIDTFGNLITNVNKELFERFGKNEPFTIYWRNKDYYIDEISSAYNSVPNGEKVAIFNHNELLEIAINRGANSTSGGAERLFGMRVGDVIRIEFTPRGSRTTIESLF